MSVLTRPLSAVVHRVIVHGDRFWKAAAWASVRVRLGARKISPMRRSSNVPAGTTRKASGSKSVIAVIEIPSALEMILYNFIVERVIRLVDVAEHDAALSSVSVTTTAPAISKDGSIALHRPLATLPIGVRLPGFRSGVEATSGSLANRSSSHVVSRVSN